MAIITKIKRMYVCEKLSVNEIQFDAVGSVIAVLPRRKDPPRTTG